MKFKGRPRSDNIIDVRKFGKVTNRTGATAMTDIALKDEKNNTTKANPVPKSDKNKSSGLIASGTKNKKKLTNTTKR